MGPVGLFGGLFGAAAGLAAWALSGCSVEAPKPGAPVGGAASNAVELRVAYGSEKKAWMEAAVQAFEATGPKTPSGRPIDVVTTAAGSGEIVLDILAGKAKPHVFSPASSAYVALLDEGWLSQAGNTAPLTGKAEPLLLSPIVVGMWRPMAVALGWPDKPIKWADLLEVSADPLGWGKHGHPEWGRFKLGHTHPGLSNSGLLAVLSETYAGAGKTRGLTAEDLVTAEPFVTKVEQTLVHYGKSTSFIADKMLERGPGYVSAIVSYENLVVDTYATPRPEREQVVAIYPAEGTFWSDHPYAVLSAPWVGDEERAAAAQLEAFLRGPEMQRASLASGFRPGDPSIAIAAPIDAAHGVDASQPKTLLDVPDAATLRAVLAMWERAKKSSDVVLVFDKSGSMRGRPLDEAKAGAKKFLDALSDRDTVSLAFFDTAASPPSEPVALGNGGREALAARIDGALADGGTALYDALGGAYTFANGRATAEPGRIHAVVVLTDGRDENSTQPLQAVDAQLRASSEGKVLVFTIGYGPKADGAVLAQLAEAGRGATALGEVDDIASVFLDMAAFF